MSTQPVLTVQHLCCHTKHLEPLTLIQRLHSGISHHRLMKDPNITFSDKNPLTHIHAIPPPCPSQLSWHPHSDHTLLMLTSDNTLRIYSTLNPHSSSNNSSSSSNSSPSLSRPQQTLRLQLDSSTSGHYGLHQPQSLATVTAFAFGPLMGWGAFTIYVLGSHGGVYGVCPVAPFGEFAMLMRELLHWG